MLAAHLDPDSPATDFVMSFRVTGPALVWYRSVPAGWLRYPIEPEFLTIEAGGVAEAAGIGDFPQVKGTSILVHAFDRQVWSLDLPSLIQTKKAAGREKDLRVPPELQSLLDAEEFE